MFMGVPLKRWFEVRSTLSFVCGYPPLPGIKRGVSLLGLFFFRLSSRLHCCSVIRSDAFINVQNLEVQT